MNDSVDENIGTMVPRIWTINLDFSVSPVAVTVEGGGCRLHDVGVRKTVSGGNCDHWEPFLVVDAIEAYLTAMGGYVCPIYARRLGATIHLSNVASRLMRVDETLRIEACLYFNYLEQKRGVICTIEGSDA